jgi:multidrug efflux system outer membrane protein
MLRVAQAQHRNQLSVLVGGNLPADMPAALPMEGQENGMELDAGTPSGGTSSCDC